MRRRWLQNGWKNWEYPEKIALGLIPCRGRPDDFGSHYFRYLYISRDGESGIHVCVACGIVSVYAVWRERCLRRRILMPSVISLNFIP